MRTLALVLLLGCAGLDRRDGFPFDEAAARRMQEEWAGRLGLPVEQTNAFGMKFVLVPPGTFLMGSSPAERGRGGNETLHPVTLTRPFYLGKHEVTVGQFRRFVEATGYVTSVEKKGGGNAHDARAVWKHTPGTSWMKPGYAGPFEPADDHPAVHVSHADARAFCAWLGPGYGLPTEAQWEWAARAGSAARFSWGEEEDASGRVANAGDRALKRVHPEWPRATMPMDDGHAYAAPVGSYRPNAFGLHDMLGNVWEFCSTRHGPYPKAPETDPGDRGTQESYDVRGGGWSNEPKDLRCAARNSDPPLFGHSNLGFRVALEIPIPPSGPEVLNALEARARETLAKLSPPADRASWERAVPRLRQSLRASLGLDRLPKPEPRNVRAVGTLDRGDFAIEKLVYETLPGAEVPAHLYRPSRAEGKLPAILFVPGHWWVDSKTRPDFQAFCATMARRGFVVLTYDPFGQGERGISWRDHRRTELLLAGVAQQAIVDFESSCALEILRSRSDVDPDRIGITGASGGGYNSWIMAALDPRIAVSVPVVGTSEFYEQLSVVRERDWYDAKEHCHFVPALLRYANNHEFAAMIAPRPLMIISAHNDHSFRIPGIRDVVGYARKLYGALGAPEKVGSFEDEAEGHGYQKRKREAAYGWFLKWLKGEGDGSPAAEPPLEIPPFDAPELRCFPAKRPAGPAMVELVKSLLGKLPAPSGPPPRSVIRKELVEALRIDEAEEPRVATVRLGGGRGVLVAAADAGKESLREHPVVAAALEAGWEVVLADPRGLGAYSTGKPGWTFAVSLLLGENFVGRQAMDLVHVLRGELRPDRPVALFGSGPNASLAATYAAVLEPRASWLVVEKGFVSYRSFVERALEDSYRLAAPGGERQVDREIPSIFFVFDVLRRFDLADLLGSLAPRPALVLDPIDGDFAPMGEEEARRRLAAGRYRWKAPPEVARSGAEFVRRVAGISRPPRPAAKVLGAPVERGGMPARVHVAEDYETEIERRWWLCGRPDRGVCRGTPAHDFDDKMGDPGQVYTAVVFNPVPGPPMGPRTRLAFRYFLRGSDRLKVQIYSLSKGYHRHLWLTGLPQGQWRGGAVDMTQARRPDGSGGPLAEDERIDDIQFYTDADAELAIDDIVLYDAAPPGEKAPFPRRIVFTGGFDTGRQGPEWPGRFEIVAREKWKAARSVGGEILLGLRGERPLRGPARLRFACRLTGADRLELRLSGSVMTLEGLAANTWSSREVDLPRLSSLESLHFVVHEGAELLLDDVFAYEH